jgi:hypothetical protein
VEALRLDTSVGDLHSHFDSFNGLPARSPGLTVGDLELDYVSKWTVNAATTYVFILRNITFIPLTGVFHRSSIEVQQDSAVEPEGEFR